MKQKEQCTRLTIAVLLVVKVAKIDAIFSKACPSSLSTSSCFRLKEKTISHESDFRD